MAERNPDRGNAPPPLSAHEQHLINLGRLFASRHGGISNFDGLVPQQIGDAATEDFPAAAPSAPPGAAHAIQHDGAATGAIPSDQRQLSTALSLANMANSTAGFTNGGAFPDRRQLSDNANAPQVL